MSEEGQGEKEKDVTFVAKKAEEKNLFRDSTACPYFLFWGAVYIGFVVFPLFFDGSVMRSRRRRNRKSATRPDKTQNDIIDYYGGPFVDGNVPRQHQTLITKKRCLADDDYGVEIWYGFTNSGQNSVCDFSFQ